MIRARPDSGFEDGVHTEESLAGLSQSKLSEMCKERGVKFSGKAPVLRANLIRAGAPMREHELTGKSVAELKKLCKERGYPVGGRKSDLIHLLTGQGKPVITMSRVFGESSDPNADANLQFAMMMFKAGMVGPEVLTHALVERSRAPKLKKAKKATSSTNSARNAEAKVTTLLSNLGVRASSNCFKRAVHLKKIILDKKDSSCLDKAFYSGKCIVCSAPVSVTPRDVLDQHDHGGDYEDDAEGGGVHCSACDSNMYLTQMCTGKFALDSGKGHNHCNVCPTLGKCIGDYREAHCDDCGKHYFAGLMGNPCSCQRGYGNDNDWW